MFAQVMVSVFHDYHEPPSRFSQGRAQGIYLLTTLVQLRTTFPPPPNRPDTEPDIGLVNLFSTLPEFQVFGTVFDSAFLIAAGVSAATFWFSHRINSVGVVE